MRRRRALVEVSALIGLFDRIGVGMLGFMILCPVNGPSIDARGARVVAWFAAADGERRVEMAFSSDGGRTFAPPIRIDRSAPPGRADTVIWDDGSALVSGMEAEEKGNEAGLFIALRWAD